MDCTNELLISSGFTKCECCKACGGGTCKSWKYRNPSLPSLMVEIFKSGAFKIYRNGTTIQFGEIGTAGELQDRLGKI